MQEVAIKSESLWDVYNETRDIEIRNELVVQYLPIVRRIVGRMAASVGSYVSYDDLISCGVIGLIDAVERFNSAKQAKFETYAYIRVKGEILDYLRKMDWASNSLRQKIKLVEQAYVELESEGREATEYEVARRLNMDTDEVRKVLENSHTFNLVYLDEAIFGGEIPEDTSSIEELFEDSDLKERLTYLVDTLNEKEKMIVSLYYAEELTLKEVGMVMDLSESRISQIHSGALMKLRSKLAAV